MVNKATNVIEEFVSDEWFMNLIKSDLIRTDSSIDYMIMFYCNLCHELDEIGDVYTNLTKWQKISRLFKYGFDLVKSIDNYAILYKYGRIVIITNTGIQFIFQFDGTLPNIVRNLCQPKPPSASLHSSHIAMNNGLGTINTYMEQHGKFIEPWDIDLFNNRELIQKFITEFPMDFKNHLLANKENRNEDRA